MGYILGRRWTTCSSCNQQKEQLLHLWKWHLHPVCMWYTQAHFKFVVKTLHIFSQMLSMIVQLDNMTRYAELLTMPNGTRSFPARSCCDLKEQYPDIPSGTLSRDDQCGYILRSTWNTGTYWIDPNGGCSADAFQVDCDYEDNGCATCIDAKTWVTITSFANADFHGQLHCHIRASRFSHLILQKECTNPSAMYLPKRYDTFDTMRLSIIL